MIEWVFAAILYMAFGIAFGRYAVSKSKYGHTVDPLIYLIYPVAWLPMLLLVLIEVYWRKAARK